MKQNRFTFKSFVSLFLVLTILFSVSTTLISCSMDDAGTEDETPPEDGGLIVDGVEIKEAFVEIDFNEIVLNAVDVKEINVEEIEVNPAIISEITLIETQVTTINDEFVYLAYQNFVDYYGEDVDWGQLGKDFLIGGAVVLVFVTVALATGGTASFFGAVLLSEFSVGALVIGAAIDAAISGYLAYQEGGDASYILGHMLNGVADGFKWGAILAPVSFAGGKLIEKGAKAIKGAINGMRASQKAAKIAALGVTAKQASDIFQHMPEIVKYTGAYGEDVANKTLKEAYQAASKELSQELTEDLFIKAFRNKSALLEIVEQLNPYNVSDKILKVSQEIYVKKAVSNISDDVAENVIKQFKNGSIKKLDDIAESALRNQIKETPGEFVKLFGNRISKELLDDIVKETLGGEQIVQKFAKSITKKIAYAELLDEMSKETLDNILDKNYFVIGAKFGQKNLNNLFNSQALYKAIQDTNSLEGISHKTIKNVMEGLFSGTVKVETKTVNGVTQTLVSVGSESIDSQVAKRLGDNLLKERDALSVVLKNMKLSKANAGLLDDIAKTSFKNTVDQTISQISDETLKQQAQQAAQLLTPDVLSKVFNNTIKKADLDEATYNQLKKYAQQLFDVMKNQTTPNKTLINDLVVDVLKEQNIPESAISKIIKGASINTWELADKQVASISNVVASYYQAADLSTYYNFVVEYADVRSNLIRAFIEEYENMVDPITGRKNTIINKKYAGGIMELNPTESFSEAELKLIKEKYGDILMTKTGSPIFDKYAIGRVVSDYLTGDSAADIALANQLHHGTNKTPVGYTWHHLEDGKTMILIPYDLHHAYKHTGGADLLRNGLKESLESGVR